MSGHIYIYFVFPSENVGLIYFKICLVATFGLEQLTRHRPYFYLLLVEIYKQVEA